MDDIKKPLECLECLRADIDSRGKETVLSFEEFLEMTRAEPQRVLRNIFQLFHDMVQANIVKGKDEYPEDPQSIGFVDYDSSKIFEQGMDIPFFPDRLLVNRFVKEVKAIKQGSQQNRIYVYIGPPGCGKSTFLNNLLKSFERYTKTKEGQSYEVLWQIEEEKGKDSPKVEIPCPSHDHPILIIPKSHRVDFLNKFLAPLSPGIRYKITNEKEYEWVFNAEACTICESLFEALCKERGSFDKVFQAVKVRSYLFNRKIGEGISVFNPGDKPLKEMYLADKQIQEKLDKIFGANRVRYVFSPLAKTNNGIYVLMDIKAQPPHNKERFWELHNIVSEGVHKVDGVEERINSLIFTLMNPEDKEGIEKEKMESFKARISENKISYVLQVSTEVKIYRSTFGKDIDSYFLPRVLENFARVIISSRMNWESKQDPLREWIGNNMQQYAEKHYCDEKGLLLRMDIYAGIIPTWLSDEDKKKFTAEIRRNLIAEAANEGIKGFSGRDSLKYFKEFSNLYGPKADDLKGGDSKLKLINMADVADYFKHKIGRDVRSENLPPTGFLDSLISWYDYTVLNEVKEALYFYNKEQIQEDILHYLCAVNYDPDGRKVRCQYTGKEIEVTTEFFKLIGSYISGEQMKDHNALRLAQDIQKKYIELFARNPEKKITETELYKNLFNSYVRNLKEKVLQPFVDNENFREAVKAFGSQDFETFDTRIREHIIRMMKNLVDKFGYTQQGAKEICLYVLDQDLVEKFP